MLDVHPPEHTPQTWRDFLLHIATIVIGLLIAVGLEQAVEYVHHRIELREAHDALDREHEDNVKIFALDTDFLAHDIAGLRNNLIVLEYLRAHPGTPRAKLPGTLMWANSYENISDIAWRSVQGANITQLMPRDQVSDLAALYEALSYMNHASDDSWAAITNAIAYTFSDPDPTHLNAAQLERQIDLTQKALVGKYRLGVVMGNVSKSFPGFTHGPSLEALQQISIAPPPTPAESAELAEAQRITKERMAAAPIPK